MKSIKKMVLSAVCLVLIFGTTGCGKDKYGLVKIKGGSLSDKMLATMDLKMEAKSSASSSTSPLKISVSVSDFYISKYEVTQELYSQIMSDVPGVNSEPSYFKDFPVEGENQNLRPVERITWYDALLFCNKLSEKEGLQPVYTLTDIERYSKDNAIKYADFKADYSRNGYRLPTNAEWIYAAAGGEKSKGFIKYSGSEDITEVAWCDKNSDDMTHQVALKKPNELGLYDMTGNVAEWCWDYQWKDMMEQRPYVDYCGPKEGMYRCIRGGSFVYLAAGAFFPYETGTGVAGVQGLRYYNVGFRIARNCPKK